MFISTELKTYLDVLKGSAFEGNVPHMYLDSAGKVTVGVGHNLTAHGGLPQLGFKVKRLKRTPLPGSTDAGLPLSAPQTVDRSATDPEKKNDYDFLLNHHKLMAYPGLHQKPFTTVEMESASIDSVFATDVQVAIADLQSIFGTAFDGYPVPAQAALIDMMFNMGKNSFRKFHHLIATVKGTHPHDKITADEKWKLAAKQSHRHGIQESRNTQIANWFKQASKRPTGNVQPQAPIPLHSY